MRRLVEAERGRATRAASVAQRHEGLAGTAAKEMRPFHLRMAELHRSTERKHLAAADLHAAYADAVRLWVDRPRDTPTIPPTFMAAVAKATGNRSMAVTLFGKDEAAVAVAVSDSVAEAAHDLEYVFGEGPSRAVMRASRTLNVWGEEALSRRWPQFGPAAHELGVQAVVSARLGPADAPMGALTAYRPDDEPDFAVTRSVGTVAEALTTTALHPAARLDAENGFPAHPLFHDVDLRIVVHQATGVVMTTHGCTAPDALALIRAHAFVRNESVTEVALAIVSRTSTLD